jgi:homoserine acetyltransferase
VFCKCLRTNCDCLSLQHLGIGILGAFVGGVVGNVKILIWLVNPPLENRTVYEIMWENVVEPDRPQIAM